MDTLEGALAAVEANADAALRAVGSAVKELRAVKAAAHAGSLRDLQRTLASAVQLTDAARESVRGLRESWDFDERAYLDSGRYTAELIAAAREQGVRILEDDDRILSYPCLVRVLPGDAAVEIDRRKVRGIRPSLLAATLRKKQAHDPRFKAPAFLEMLYRAYRLKLAENGQEPGATVKLLDVYDVITLGPGVDYSKPEFARDLYQLDRSGHDLTRDGHRVSFPAATGTKGSGVLTTVTTDGEMKLYFGIAFRR